MIIDEVEEVLDHLTDKALLCEAVKYFRLALAHHGKLDADPEEMLDFIYIECARRGKEWIYDKAHEAAFKETMVCAL